MSNKGYMWVCQNNGKTDYAELSRSLARSLKEHNKDNLVCVLTDKDTQSALSKIPEIDIVNVMSEDDSVDHDIKWANEYKVFSRSPFTHTIKLAADMLWTTNTDWWWNYLWQHDMVFAVDCFNYKNKRVGLNQTYRPFHKKNFLPNIYSDLTYFRKSRKSVAFGKICQMLTQNWQQVRESMLINCHDKYPSTDVVYALAYRIIDPVNKDLVDYPWFKFIHNKRFIHGLTNVREPGKYLTPYKVKQKVMLGGHALTRPWHYVDKNTVEDLNARIF